MFKFLINSQVKKSETYTIGLQIKKHYDIRFKKRDAAFPRETRKLEVLEKLSHGL